MQADLERIQQAISNVIGNAIKFTPRRGRVDICLSAIPPYVELRVSDSGEGISPEFLPLMFERFRQADSTIRRMQGGLGIGLALVRHIVELHGGTVSAASAGRGQGTTVVIRILEAAGAAARAPQPAAAPSEERALLEGVRVLLVEDDPDTREVLKEVLRFHQADVTAVGSAAEALRALGAMHPHVIVSDVAMPEEDGYELIQRIRRRAPEEGGDVPALALTACARREDHVRALTAGFQMHAAKPIEPDDLVAAVARLASGVGNPGTPGHGARTQGSAGEPPGASAEG